MANLKANPWTIFPTDPATDAISAITLNADGTVSITGTSGLTFNMTAEPPEWFTVIDVTNAAYNGFYKLIPGKGTSGGTAWVMVPQFNIPAGTAASSGGTLAQCLYREGIRMEDLSWQKITAAGQLLDFRDRNGNIIWQATAYAAGFQNRGKLFWVDGLTPIELDSGVVIITIN